MVLVLLVTNSTIASAASSGITYHVSVGGNDSNPGTLAQPLKTIQKCLDRVQPGDTCEIMGGTYNESLTLKTSGTVSAPIYLHGDGGVTVNSGANEAINVGSNVHYYTIENIKFISTRSEYTLDFQGGWDRFGDTGNNGFILRGLYVEGGVNFYGHNNLVENSELNGRGVAHSGIHERDKPSHDNTYRNNRIHDYTSRGIWSMDMTARDTVEGNTIYNIGGWGINFDGASYGEQSHIVWGNTIYAVTGEGVGIQLENNFGTLVDGNTVYNVTTGVHTVSYGLTGSHIASQEYRLTDTGNVISNNVIHDTGAEGILCRSAPGGSAINNTIYNTNTSRTYFGAVGLSRNYDYYCRNWRITGNKISVTNSYAFWMEFQNSDYGTLILNGNYYDFASTAKEYYRTTYTSRTASTVSTWALGQMREIGYELSSVTSDNPPTVVPPTATARPPTATTIPPTSSSTVAPTNTVIPPTKTNTPTATNTPVPTSFTPTPTASSTVAPILTATSTRMATPSDLVVPAAITTLGATTVLSYGTVNLSWTAPGDDGYMGTATSYQVRYSASAITSESAWNAATAVTSGVPAPAAVNTGQNMTVSGLTAGMTYYFAIRAQDEEANLGGLGNSPSAIAATDQGVGKGKYDDTHSVWIYTGAWTAYSGAGPSNNTLHTSQISGNLTQFTFEGTKFVLTYTGYTNRGVLDVYVDNVKVYSLNQYASSLTWKKTWTSGLLTKGVHIVKLVHASGAVVDVDAIRILP